MKILFILLLIMACGSLRSQDTIFVKTGEVIPAVIISRDGTEIRYKKAGQPEQAAVYSIFVTDVKSIHFSDGIVADYTSTVPSDNVPSRPVDLAGKMGVGKISFGVNAAYFDRDPSDALSRFWERVNGPVTAPIDGNPAYFPAEIRLNMVLGQARRVWIGTGLELIFTPENSILSVANEGSEKISFKSWYYNIPLYFGHTINQKKSIIAIFEPSANIAFMSGTIRVSDTDYEVKNNMGFGWAFAGGFDWIVSKRLLANVRAGYKFVKIKESHVNEASSTGYQSFYVDKSVSEELLSVSWNGPYVSAGLAWCIYFKMKGFVD